MSRRAEPFPHPEPFTHAEPFTHPGPFARPEVGRRLAAAGMAAGGTRLAARLLAAHPPGGAARWTRTNHRGEPVSLLEGPAFLAGTLAGVLLTRGITARTRAGAVLAVAGAGGFGLLDDLAERAGASGKGLRGHLGALRRGRLTTGTLKIMGIGLSGLLGGALALPPTPGRPGGGARASVGPWGRTVDVLTAGALVAGAANLLNLLDLRPGRALKATLLGAALAGPAAAPAGGAAAAALPADLAEGGMLGDTGANAAGALLGVALVGRLGRPARALTLAGVVGLTLASERVSFTAIIESTPGLSHADRWGRRPPAGGWPPPSRAR